MNKPNSSLSQFIEEYPLYVRFGTDQPIEVADLNNLVFNFFCKKENEVQPFRLVAALHNANGLNHASSLRSYQPSLSERIPVDFIEIFTGICQSCEGYKVNIILNGASQEGQPKYFIRKIGQYPAPDSSMIKLPGDIAGFLHDESRELYQKALKSLELEFGIAALAYFSRMIKIELGRIIGILSNPYSQDGNKLQEAFNNYKQEGRKTKFIEDVTPYLPVSLKEHGANALLFLDDAVSPGLSELTEKECFKKAKDIDSLFRYIVRRVSVEIHEALTKKAPDKYFLRYS